MPLSRRQYDPNGAASRNLLEVLWQGAYQRFVRRDYLQTMIFITENGGEDSYVKSAPVPIQN